MILLSYVMFCTLVHLNKQNESVRIYKNYKIFIHCSHQGEGGGPRSAGW